MNRFILDEIADKKAVRIHTTADKHVTIVFEDGDLDITEFVDFGCDADLAKLAAFAKIISACGFAETQAAFRVMRDSWWRGYEGDLWPAPPEWNT